MGMEMGIGDWNAGWDESMSNWMGRGVWGVPEPRIRLSVWPMGESISPSDLHQTIQVDVHLTNKEVK